MGKNITIQEGGVAKQLTVDKLKTNEVGGGTCLWIPEDEVLLGTLNITENGTFKANEYGYYGFSEVNANAVGIASGTVNASSNVPSAEDIAKGNEYLATQDSNGNLTFSELPSKIVVTTNPTKTVYADGDIIDFSGLVVKAYKNDGTLWEGTGYTGGIIPDAEQIRPKTEADIDAVDEEGYASADGKIKAVRLMDEIVTDQYNGIGVWRTREIGKTYQSPPPYDGVYMGTDTGGVFAITRYNDDFYVCHIQGDTRIRHTYKIPYQDSFYYYRSTPIPFITHGKFVDAENPYASHDFSIPESTANPDGLDINTLIETGGTMKVPIKWVRPGGKELETYFEITVEAAEPQGDEGGDTPAPHDDPTIYYEDVNEAINLALMGGDETVYFKGNTYTMEEAIALRDSSPHRL